MTAEFFIHGPRHAFYGKAEESPYCQMFDNSQVKDEIRFVVEIRKSGDGNLYSYYTYCRYANVLDVGGRSGAYIGMTLRLSAYYANLRNLYTILDAIFNAQIVGFLVQKQGNGFQYLVSDFKASQEGIKNKVEKYLEAMLQGGLSNDEIYSIDSSFNLGGREIIKGIDDNQYTKDRLADIKKSGKLIFASSQELDSVTEMNTKFSNIKKDIRSELNRELIATQAKLSDTAAANIDLQEKNTKKEKKISELENSEASLKQQLLQNQDKLKELQNEIEKQNKQISELKSSKESLEDALKSKGQENAELLSRLESSPTYLQQELQLQVENLQRQLQDKQEKFEQWQEKLDQLLKYISSLSRDKNERLINEIDSLQNELNKQKDENSRLNEEINGPQNSDLQKDNSPKVNAHEFGEGLKKGIIAFFLVAVTLNLLLQGYIVFSLQTVPKATEEVVIKAP